MPLTPHECSRWTARCKFHLEQLENLPGRRPCVHQWSAFGFTQSWRYVRSLLIWNWRAFRIFTRAVPVSPDYFRTFFLLTLNYSSNTKTSNETLNCDDIGQLWINCTCCQLIILYGFVTENSTQTLTLLFPQGWQFPEQLTLKDVLWVSIDDIRHRQQIPTTNIIE